MLLLVLDQIKNKQRRYSRSKRFSLVLFLSLSAVSPLGLQVSAHAEQVNSQATTATNNSDTQSALEEVQHNLQISNERLDKLKSEIEKLKGDSKDLDTLLTKVAKRERGYSQEIAARTVHLQDLAKQMQHQQSLLDQQRGEMAELLAGLEKMGYNPPPAILVQTDDALQSIYASTLMGALLPQIQEKTKILRDNLQQLKQVEASITHEQDELRQAQEKQVDERMRLALLLEEKGRQRNQTQKNIQAEEQNRRLLAEKAQSLQDLLGEVATQKQNSTNSDQQIQIAKKVSTLRGHLQRPVEGEQKIVFGQKKDNKSAQGEEIETKPGAIVLSPAEGTVRYAGKFRSYGQVVILDAGENYYFVLAGMSRINVSQGQFLLQGEPVGNMENLLIADNGNLMMSKVAPKLYIEIRKNGRPINPDPWWEKKIN